QHVEHRVLDAEQTHGAHDTTGAGQQAERDLGQTDAAALDVGGDAVVAGQGDLQAAAQGGAVDGGDDRPAQRLQSTQLLLQFVAVLGDRLGVGGGRLDEVVEVTAGEERLLRRSDHHTG